MENSNDYIQYCNNICKFYKDFGYNVLFVISYDGLIRAVYEKTKNNNTNKIKRLYEFFKLVYNNYITELYKTYTYKNLPDASEIYLKIDTSAAYKNKLAPLTLEECLDIVNCVRNLSPLLSEKENKKEEYGKAMYRMFYAYILAHDSK